MPAIAKTSDADVVAAARKIIGENGLDGLSMHAIASAVGIKAPSLYKRFIDRNAIIRCVQLAEFSALTREIEKAVAGVTPAEAIRAIAHTHWTLAEERPQIYSILFTPGTITQPEDIAIRTEALMPLFVASRALVGPGTGLAAARTLASYIHGFISMHLSGAFDFGLTAIIKGMGG